MQHGRWRLAASLACIAAFAAAGSAEAKTTLVEVHSKVNELWDSGKCRGAGVEDPSGNPIMLHRRYAPRD